MLDLLNEIKKCTICLAHLENGVNPVLSASEKSKIIIIGQAPGSIVHRTGIPWNDKSGDRLRDWLGVSKDDFYNEKIFALIPMGFCYPGKGKTGDLPPRKECAPQWHNQLFKEMKDVELTLLVGSYSQNFYLNRNESLTETVRNFEKFLPDYIPLPHPSPRNNIWLRKNPWFEESLIPILKEKIRSIV